MRASDGGGESGRRGRLRTSVVDSELVMCAIDRRVRMSARGVFVSFLAPLVSPRQVRRAAPSPPTPPRPAHHFKQTNKQTHLPPLQSASLLVTRSSRSVCRGSKQAAFGRAKGRSAFGFRKEGLNRPSARCEAMSQDRAGRPFGRVPLGRSAQRGGLLRPVVKMGRRPRVRGPPQLDRHRRCWARARRPDRPSRRPEVPIS